MLEPEKVRHALDRMNAGDASQEVFEILVSAAEAYADMKPEMGFESPQPGLIYVSRNDMLIETMHAGRPEAKVLLRFAPDWKGEVE